MYFGTREHMSWIPCPVVERPSGLTGFSEPMVYLNGGAHVERSYGGHRNFEMSWNYVPREMAGRIEAFASGVYGRGPFYWVDPMSATHNVLPMNWAAPGLGAEWGVPIHPALTTGSTPVNTGEYPAVSAVGSLTASAYGPELWIPVPPGHTAHVGVHGTGGSVNLRRTSGVTVSSREMLTTLPVASSQRTNTTVSGDTHDGFFLQVGRASGSGAVTLSGMIVQILPNGRTVPAGGWLDGAGHSGCEFAEFPERVDYNAILDQVGVNAVLTEVGTWL